MTKEEFLKNFANHIIEAKKYYDRDKFLQDLKCGSVCPFRNVNLKKASFFNSSLILRETNEFRRTSYYYIFHRSELEKEMIQIIEKEWNENSKVYAPVFDGKIYSK